MGDELTTALHIYEMEEANGVRHWAVATCEEEALRLVRETVGEECLDDLQMIWQIPDDAPHPVAYVDGFDEPDRWQQAVPPGATVEERDGYPVVTATAGEWARWFGCQAYDGCSEDY